MACGALPSLVTLWACDRQGLFKRGLSLGNFELMLDAGQLHQGRGASFC